MKAVDDGVPYSEKLSKDEILKTTDKCACLLILIVVISYTVCMKGVLLKTNMFFNAQETNQILKQKQGTFESFDKS
ncbi:hypothetical protein K7432_016025 [Basidiobolus ranarum]|uniref:Uncharacterized protein n=1 Tax=Basidiobolus ranarum TaxID=34480 RepID=A0ABR2WFE6_9FUNG